MEVLLYFLTGAGIGVLLTYLSTRIGRKGMEVNLRILQEKAKAWEEKEQRWQEEKMALIRDNERLKENLRQTEEKWRGQKEEILQIAALQKEQFQNLANDILEDKSRRFTEANRENIERILGPLNKDIQEFRKKVEESYSKETVERTVLERKIAELVQLNNRIREDAVNLTNALKGNTKTQGDWGEMILERILENSGLTKGREYFIQETLKDESDRVIRTENGNTMRPDVIVVYPDNRKVIIDSKVSLTAYVDYCNAETETEREVALKAHLLSVRKHIDELSARNYCDWCDGALDFVMLFIPNESSYVLAMQSEPTLWHEAYRKRVLLLIPSNLIVSLKLTADLWSREYQNRHAQEIAERGAKLYDKCVAFLESLTAIGDNIRRTEESYRQALNRLKEGNGNLISQTLKLKELGVKSRRGDKEIPEELIR
ncbi:MAG: DNA recombination protein RmuC [Odoribacter splanchnicus]